MKDYVIQLSKSDVDSDVETETDSDSDGPFDDKHDRVLVNDALAQEERNILSQ